MLVVSARQTSPRLVSCVPNGGETRVRQRDKSWASCVGFSISSRRGNTISKCAAVEKKPNTVEHNAYMVTQEISNS